MLTDELVDGMSLMNASDDINNVVENFFG